MKNETNSIGRGLRALVGLAALVLAACDAGAGTLWDAAGTSPKEAPGTQGRIDGSMLSAVVVGDSVPGSRTRNHRPGPESAEVAELVRKISGGHEASLLDVYRIALSRDTLFKASRYERQASHAAWRQARAGLLPAAGFSFERRDITQEITQSDNPIFAEGKAQFPAQALVLEVAQPLYDPSKFIRWKQAKTEYSMVDAQVEAAHQDLIIRVSQAYLDALSAQRLVHYRELAVADLVKLKSLVDRRYERKLVPVTDRDATRSRWELAQAELIRARAAHAATLLELEEICGAPVRQIAPMTDEIPMVPPSPASVDFWLAKGRSWNSWLKSFEYDTLRKKQEVHRLRATRLPTLMLVSRYDDRDTGGTIFGGGNQVLNREVLVRMQVPLFQGGLTRYRIREAENHQLSQEQAQERVARQLKRETEVSFRRVLSSIAQGQALRNAIQAQEKVVSAMTRSYEAGLVTGVMVLDAQRDLYNARHRYEECRNEYVLSGLLLNQSAGALDAGHLSIVNQWLVEAGPAR